MSKRERVNRVALLTGGRSRVPSTTANPLRPAEPEPQSAAALAMNLPAPREFLPDSPVLLDDERRDLAACELAVDHLRVAFWAAGKALQVIRDGRLYRETHDTFEAYVGQRWDMSRAQAYRLIEAWPVAEQLSVSPIGDTLTESQVRALLPVARRHGPDVAAEVYREVAGTEGLRVTAALLADAARAIPDSGGQLAASQAAEAVRVFLAGQRDGGQDDEKAGAETPEGAAAVVRLQQAVAALRKADTALSESVLAAAFAADERRALELASEAASVALKLGGRAGTFDARRTR